MSDLFTKAAKVKTTTKLWTIGIALLIMVNVPYVDNHHYQPSPVAAPTASAPVAVQPSTPAVAPPRPRSLKAPDFSAQPSAQPASLSSVAGDYAGSVHNETAAVSADFAIRLQEAGGTLSGSMTVKPPLYGSGPLEGSTSGADVAFTVTSPIGKITFAGSRSEQRITGTYTVTQPAGGIEKGTFTLDRTSRVNRTPTGTFEESPTAATLPAITVPDVQVPKPMPLPVTETVTTPPPTRRVVEHSDPKNYSSCLSGFSYACNKALLTSEEAANVEASDLRRNYSSCINGFSYACNKSLLTADEAAKVKASDLRRNYSSCTNGFSYACNKALLTAEEAVAVEASDLRRNYSSCLDGFSYACDKNLLTPEELSRVQTSDLRRNYTACMNLLVTCDRTLLTQEQLLRVQAKDEQRQH